MNAQGSQGQVERPHGTLEGLARVYKLQVEKDNDVTLMVEHPVVE